MDERLVLLLTNGDSSEAQQLLLPYFEEYKKTDQGWKVCGDVLSHNSASNERITFFCLQIMEVHAKERYSSFPDPQKDAFKQHLMDWYRQCCSFSENKKFILNKTAQLICILFVQEYPSKWHNLFADMLSLLPIGPLAVDIYLRVLLALDEEVVARHIPHTQLELDRNTAIKDRMRDHCIPDLVESWFTILKTYEMTHPELVCLCLQVIGAYILWIDIGLIANDRFIGCLLGYLAREDVRESSCECFLEIINKGMSASAKTQLVESLVEALERTGVLSIDSEDIDGEFPEKVSNLINGIGVQLITSYNKLTQEEIDAGMNVEILQAIDKKVPHLLRFLGDEDDDVSEGVFESTHAYVNLLKGISAEALAIYKPRLMAVFSVTVDKMKYDVDFNFKKETESEAEFLEYRKQMRILVDNLAKVDDNLILNSIHSLVTNTLKNWRNMAFMDVEVAIYILYLLGESLPGQQLYTEELKFTAFQEMMELLINSEVSKHEHSAVKLQYFEVAARYERFFYTRTHHIPHVLISFLDERGLQNPDSSVNSRCSFLLMRFVKALKNQIHPYVEDVLKRLQGLLVNDCSDNGSRSNIGENDLYYLYEVAAILITCTNQEPQKQVLMMQQLFQPIVQKFNKRLDEMGTGVLDELLMYNNATELHHLMAYAGRASKAFTSQQSCKASGCDKCFTEALSIFLRSLAIPVHREVIHGAVRQYLHRMIICLGEDLLPFVPVTVTQLLKDCEMRDIQEFIPLINQVIARCKGQIAPYLSKILMAFVTQIFTFIQRTIEENDLQALKEKQLLQRSYFLFLSTIVTNNIAEVLTSQDYSHFKDIVLSLVHGAVEIPDPQGQKTCFVTFNKLIDIWGKQKQTDVYRDIIYEQIMTACFMAPMKPTFDLDDAQTALVLQEISVTQKNILDKRGAELIEWLRTSYFPQNNCPADITHEYCHALASMNNKQFKAYLKVFYKRMRP